MIPKIIQQLLWHLNAKKNVPQVWHEDYYSIICVPELLSKNPILRRKIDLPEKFGQKNTLYVPKFFGKMCCFRTKQLWNCTLTNEYWSVVYPIPEWKRRTYRKPENLAEKIDALGFYCPRWSEMSPKSLWNDKFDQIFADFARKSIAGNVFGEKLQQYNARAHNSILSKTWFSENGLEILENWPPNSPDINIIENVWSLLKKRVFQRHPRKN